MDAVAPRFLTQHRSRRAAGALLGALLAALIVAVPSAAAQSIGIGVRIGATSGAEVRLDGGAGAPAVSDHGSLVGSVGSVGYARTELVPRAGAVVGRVRVEDIVLLSGRVTIDLITLDAEALSSGAAAVTGFVASGVTVDGVVQQPPPGGSIELGGAGVLVFAEQVTSGGGLRANALRLEVSDPALGVPLGTAAVFGHLDLAAPAAEVVVTEPPTRAPVPQETGEGGSDDRVAVGRPDSAADRPASGADGRPPVGYGGTGDGGYGSSSPPLGGGLGLPVRTAPAADADIGHGGYAFPVLQDYGYIDDYAAPRAGTGWHHGIDIFAPSGTPLVAVADGTLSKVGVNTLGGNRFWLTDNAGNAFYYAHLSAYAAGVVNGAQVRAGQVIGFVGNSGQAITTPPHLHFEIHPGGGDSVNPYPYLLAWERGSSVALAFQAATVARGQVPAAGVLLIDITPPREVIPADGDRAQAVG